MEAIETAEAANETPTCPKCGGTSFRHWPDTNTALKCGQCGMQSDPSDLVGERFEFLKAEYAK